MSHEENLKNGKRTQFSGGLAAREAQKKSAASRKRNNTIRKLGQQMLSTPLPVGDMPDGEKVLAALKGFGFDTNEPELQMLILARIGTLAISDNPKTALAATNLLMEITGNDVRTQIAQEQREIDRARLKLEREKLDALKKDGTKEALNKLDELLRGIDDAAKR